MTDDNFNKIFKMMNELFNPEADISDYSDYFDFSQSEKQMDNEYIYFTIKVKGLTKDDILVSVDNEFLDIQVIKSPDSGFKVRVSSKIIPNETKVTLKNEILDVILKRDNSNKEIVAIDD